MSHPFLKSWLTAIPTKTLHHRCLKKLKSDLLSPDSFFFLFDTGMAQNLQFSVSGSDYLETILYFNVRKYVQLLGLV